MSDPPPARARWAIRIVLGALVGAYVGARWAAGHQAGSTHPFASGPGDYLTRMSAMGFTLAMQVSLLTWVLFSVYWSWAARNASPAARSESRASRLVHLVIVSAGQILVVYPVPGLRARLWPAAWPVVALGLLLNVAAFGLAVWARRRLGRHWSGEITTKVDHELITVGPYAFVRHPIYTAVFGLCVGTWLVSGELHGLVGTLLVAIAYARKIHLEERNLAGNFGPQWESYRARTKALIPGVS